jgi:hypothetical protein
MERKITFKVISFIFLFLFILGISSSYSQMGVGSVQGQVLNQNRMPIPGLTLFLVHPSLGRSHPVFSDNMGGFIFYNIPFQQRYYLEIYWGNRLIYRQICPGPTPQVSFQNLGQMVLPF